MMIFCFFEDVNKTLKLCESHQVLEIICSIWNRNLEHQQIANGILKIFLKNAPLTRKFLQISQIFTFFGLFRSYLSC
jgi:hypothetical protein